MDLLSKIGSSTVFDEEKLMRLVGECYHYCDFESLAQVMSEDSKYIGRSGIVRAEGIKGIVDYLTDITSKNRLITVYYEKVVGYGDHALKKLENIEYEVGTHCIAFPSGSDDPPFTYVFIKMGKDGKISQIRYRDLDVSLYKLEVIDSQEVGRFDFLTEEQIDFICKECKITRKQLVKGTEEDFDNWCNTLAFIESDAVDYEEDTPRVKMAESILDLWSDFDEDEDE